MKYVEPGIFGCGLKKTRIAPSTFLFLLEDKYRIDRFDEWARSSVG